MPEIQVYAAGRTTKFIHADEILKGIPGLKYAVAYVNGVPHRIVGRNGKGPIWARMKENT